MVSALSSFIKVRVDVGSEQVTFTLRRPTPKEQSKFLGNRYSQKRNKVTANLYPARVEFINGILVDIENASYETASGEMRPLNKDVVLSPDDNAHVCRILGVNNIESWKDLIPVSWKSSAAMYFEDPDKGDEGEEGN